MKMRMENVLAWRQKTSINHKTYLFSEMERGVLTTLYKVCAINNEEMRIIGNCYQSYQIPNYLILNEAYVYKFFDH